MIKDILLEDKSFFSNGKELSQYYELSEETKTNLSGLILEKIVSSIKFGYDKADMKFIRESEGDIEKLKSYDYMRNALSFMNDVAGKSNNTKIINNVKIIENALNNLIKFKKEFKFAYETNNEIIQLIYEFLVIGCITATSTYLAFILRFLKENTSDHFDSFIKKNRREEVEITSYIENLEKFNKTAISGDFSKFINYTIKNSKLNEDVIASIIIGVTAAVVTYAIILIALGIFNFIRNIAYYYYKTKQYIADYLNYLTEFTKSNIESLDPKKDKHIIEKQKKVVERLTNLAKKFEVTMDIEYKNVKNKVSKENKEFYKNSKIEQDNIESNSKEENNSNTLLI